MTEEQIVELIVANGKINNVSARDMVVFIERNGPASDDIPFFDPKHQNDISCSEDEWTSGVGLERLLSTLNESALVLVSSYLKLFKAWSNKEKLPQELREYSSMSRLGYLNKDYVYAFAKQVGSNSAILSAPIRWGMWYSGVRMKIS